MKLTIDIDSEEKTMSRAIFEMYRDVKKKELTKIQIPVILTMVECDCKNRTSYKILTK